MDVSLFHAGDVVHRAVEVQGLAGVVVSDRDPRVRGKAPGTLRLTRLGEGSAGSDHRAGEGVHDVTVSRHG